MQGLADLGMPACSVSAGNPKHVELPPVVVPPHLWLRSERPTGGRVLHFAIPGAFFVAGLLAPTMTSRLALIGSSVIFLVLIPALIQHYLEVLGTRVACANRVNAAELKRTLRGRPMVSLFAPQAWVALQEAQLALRLGDGQTAAKGFAETARLCKRPDAVMLISAQAHALVVAGDRKAARELLDKLAAAKLLGPRDQLDLGIVMLLESHKRSRQAMAYVEAARKTIGEHPRVIAAMALGLQRAERIDEAAALLEKAQISLQEEPDAVVEELVNRARRDMRRYIEAQLRRERRARSRRTTVVVTSEHAVSEIVSGEIASRGDSGASPRAGEESKDGVSSAVADALADSEALRSRGWQDPSAFAGKSPEETQPKVKVELRDPSLGEPIRIEKSYTLKPKPKSKSHKVASAGPAIDIDLADDGADTDEVESSEAIEKTEAGEAVAESSGLMTPPLPTVESKPGGLAAAIGALVQGGPEAPAPAAVVEERPKLALESLAEALRPRSATPEVSSGTEESKVVEAAEKQEAPAPERPAERSSEADAPVSMRRGRTMAVGAPVAGASLPKLPTFGKPGERAPAGGAPTFAPPPAKTGEDSVKPGALRSPIGRGGDVKK